MAKPVDLSKTSDADLLARVTGQKKAGPALPTPPAARPPAAAAGGVAAAPLAPGFKGKLPVPRNVPVFTPDPANLTEEERLALQEIRWQPGEQITGNVAELIAQARADENEDKQAELDRLAKLNPTQVKVETADLASLPADRAAEVRRKMAETMAAAQMEREAKEQHESLIGMPDSVRDALRTATAPTGLEVEDDREPASPEPRRPAPDGEKADRPPPLSAADAGGTAGHPGNCPHCGWDLGEPDDTPITEADKTTFVASVLGEKSFARDYPLFGGAVTATFRSLTGREIDVIYAQVFHEQKRGEIATNMDFYERINRYRLYLQLVGLKSNGFHHEFPEGFTPATNDTAQSYYTLPDDLADGETGLRLVERHVTGKALKTEIIVRTVTNECRRFNRLVAKLEALADNSDFWQATGDAP